MRRIIISGCIVLVAVCLAVAGEGIDEQVGRFLEDRAGTWGDMNIPARDGHVLYDLIVENNYTKALEIGTSTGHSTIWIAWALHKTGGRLVTIEIDERRHKEALENLREAGLENIVDARLGDAHDLVRELAGPFDFVFSDADKPWYRRYLEMLLPKIEEGGCFTAHNVLNLYAGIDEFRTYLDTLSVMETTILRSSPSGLSISFKKSD